MKNKVFYYLPFIGLLILILSSFILYLEIPFMETWFYSFGWWSFILIVDGVNFRLNRSSFLSRSASLFLQTAVFSVSVWLVFEVINISLNNWMYFNLPDNTFERWIGYFIAFATVIPALIELSDFFNTILPEKNFALFRVKISPNLLNTFIVMGVIFLVLTTVWPEYFFPLVWLCFVFILEPVNYKKNNPSLLKKMENNHWKVFWSWCLAGFTAGFVWEFLNFYSGTKWDYSIPYFDFARLFHMPLLGYFGFIPFALEIYAVFQLFLYYKKKLKNKVMLKVLLVGMALMFNLFVFYLIDTYSSFS